MSMRFASANPIDIQRGLYALAIFSRTPWSRGGLGLLDWVRIVIRRLFWFFVGFAATAIPMLVYATVPPVFYLASPTVGECATVEQRCTQTQAAQAAANHVAGNQPQSLSYSHSAPNAYGATDYWYVLNYGNNGSGGYSSQVYVSARGRLGTCPEGTEYDATTGQCTQGCQQGTTGTIRIDIAYRSNTDTTSSASLFGRRDVPSTSCDGSCQVTVGSYAGGCNLYGSTAPYIVSCSYNTTTTGQQCSTADSNDPLPPVPCPTGTAPGYVNGAGGCYPVSETTTTTTPPTTNPDGSTTTTTQTTNPDGTVTTTTETTNPDGSKTITITTGPGSTGGTGGGSQPGENPADGPTDQCAADPSACEQEGNGGPFTGPEGVLYERHDFGEDQPTFFLAMNDFVETMENTRIVKAITGFYDVGNLSATCPVWSATVPMLNTTVVIDHFCTPTAQLMLNIAWAVVQIAFAYAAFRIAFL